ncbi:MAG: hypothetical protein ACXVXN_06355 [Mycobacteriaceae bacterium]
MSTPTVEDTAGVTAPPPPAAVSIGAPGTGMKSPAAVGRVARGAARATVTLGATVSFMFAWALQATAQTVPDFNPQQPTGGNELLKIGGMLKWVAIYGCSAAFFGGLCCLAGGRLLDHRGSHKIGIGLMFSSVGVAILVGSGVGLLNAFTSGN